MSWSFSGVALAQSDSPPPSQLMGASETCSTRQPGDAGAGSWKTLTVINDDRSSLAEARKQIVCENRPFVLWGRDSRCELSALKMHQEAVGVWKVAQERREAERRGGRGAPHRSDDGTKGVSAAGERVCRRETGAGGS